MQMVEQASDIAGEARLMLQAACNQVEDMIAHARSLILKAEAEADTIVEDGYAAARRITEEARVTAAALDRVPCASCADQTFTSIDGVVVDPPAPQKKSFAAMWARAADEADSVDDFLEGLEQRKAAEVWERKLGKRWRDS